jgi:hypothetical protein
MKVGLSFLAFYLPLAVCVGGTITNQGLRRNTACPDGYGGINCNVVVNECNASPYPCTGGTTEGSFCVDYDPPKKFKCGCRPGYDAVLPNATEVMDPVPVEWRPLKCRPRDVCVGVVCHEDATCIVSSNNTAVCVCNDELTGDGITNCAPVPRTVVAKTSSPPSPPCKADSDCNKLENSVCVDGSCLCKSGFYQSNGRGRCINENECAIGYPNDCHRSAICKDTEGSYTCSCKDGYRDLNPNDKPGTVCAQINECVDPSLNNCNNETQVCLDLPPPSKWQCVERTPAPTPVPIKSCVNDKTGINTDTGCTSSKRFCVADPGKVGLACAFCINDDPPSSPDLGCGGPESDGDVCYDNDGKNPPLNGGGTNCGVF